MGGGIWVLSQLELPLSVPPPPPPFFFRWMLAMIFAVCHRATPVARALAAAGLEVAAGFAVSVRGWGPFVERLDVL